ncbi:filamentous hemagglutinin family domain protein [Selenomonas sp. oral taxon 892 str. F0426]|uniref:YDG domain-containing protein n=1 Tax=Selenomonas sp. oral taxon 892 TaxID=1321785 RepID=UPI0003AD70CB|nr:YDG domain-containing protein [Selenomonas sp. oral taxon 892]ERJ92947.1 filamentous hemagglutinin family domain protein [Selenomonas sp. oral taxon 892 str. F0426]
MKSASTKQLRRKLLCALVAGALAAPFAAQTAYALPIEGANAATNKTEADISTSGTVMNIMGKTDHNILKWEDFSIDSGEKVRFDGGSQTRDYLNLVTGEGASNIYGTIEGGRNVYLVNPHGILFAKGSQVNTGALYLSTANPADIAAATSTFKTNGTSPLSATAQTGDVLNLGTVKASKLYIEGKNVKVLNTDAVTDANGTALTGANVTIRSEDAPHIGYDVANTTTRNFTVNGATVSKNVSDYANANTSKSASTRGWVVQNLGGTAHTDYDYMRVHDVYELQHMDANRVNAAVTGSDKKIIGRYMLANDIAASETQDWDGGFQPIGSSDNSMGAFTGRFDGAGHTITGLTVKPPAPTDSFGRYSRGMFAYIDHACIENVSLKDASVSGEKDVGGIVGATDHSCVVRNVSFSGKVYGSGTVVGGIVGTLKRSTIENVYHEGAVEGNKAVGGIVGYVFSYSTVQNVRNAGKVIGNEMLGGIAGVVDGGSRVQNALQTGTVEQRAGQTDSQVGGVVGLLNGDTVSHAVWKEGSVKNGNGALIRKGVGKTQGNFTVTDVKEHSLDDMKKAATYAEWGSDVATEGGKRMPWRIYDGKTMPLLTAFLRTKHLANRESVYDGTAPTIAGLAPGITWTAGKDAGTYHAYSEQYDIIGGAYTVKPKELTLDFKSGTRFDKLYDGSDTATRTLTNGLNYRLTGFVSSEDEDNIELVRNVTGKYADKNAGEDKEVTFQNLALTGTGAGNYTVKKAQGVGTIYPKQLNLTLTSGARFDKTYDGNANVTQSLAKGTHYNLTGFVGSEGTGIALASSTGTYSDKNAAADKAVTFNGLTLTGAGAGNYTLDKTSLTGIGTILRRALTLGAVGAQTKTYDGTTDADTSKFGAVLNNVVAGEENSVKATATGAAYNSKDVAAASTIDYTGVALSGADAGNYSLAATTAQGTGTITKRALTVGTVAAQSKTYDGTTSADASKFRAALDNLVAGEEGSVAATATGATYNDKNVAAANKVSYTGLALTGTGAGNYSLAAATAEGKGTITRRTLTVDTVTVRSKTYDGTTAADAAQFHATLGNVVAGEESSVAATATGAAYNDKNAAGANRIDYTGIALTGAGAANYTVADTAQGAGTITQRALTLGTVAQQSKTYDGTTAADASKFRAALNNTVTGDSVTATATGATYNDKNVAAANRIDYTGVGLAGADAGNYSLAATTAQGTGTIAKRTLTVGAVTAQTKTYDGTTAADAAAFRATLGNVVAGEENLVAATAAGAAYNDKNVAGANAVSYTGVALTGTGAGNYTVATTAEGRGTITPRALTLGAVAAQSKTYDGTTSADTSKFGAVLNNVVAGEENSVKATATGAAYNSKDVAAASTIDYTGVALAGAEAGNYTLAATTAQGVGTISRRALTVDTVAAQSKTYDGNTAADASKFHATLGNFVAGEEGSVTATAAGATYNDKNVAGANAVSYTGVALQGTGAGNYTIANTTEGQGSITAKQLNLALTGGARFDKTYDGTANVTQSLTKGTNYTLTGFIGTEGDHLALASATGAYTAGKDAGTDKEVTFKNLTLMGTGAGNYTLDTNALTGIGTIAPRALTLGEVGAQTKTYDGTTAADASKFRAALGNVVAGEENSVTATATDAAYNDKNVAGANAVSYTGVALTGTGARNYTIANTAEGAGTITSRDLTLIADAKSVVQGEPLPFFTGRAEGFVDGEDPAVFGTGGLTFESMVTNTETPGSYAVIGKAGGIRDGLLGNYRIRQAPGNATAFIVNAMPTAGGILAALVQDAVPRFDFGFGEAVYLYGTPRPISAATLGFYRFAPARDFGIEGVRLDEGERKFK